MKLSHEEGERYIEQICSGTKIIEVNEKVFVLKYPDTSTLMKARLIYDQDYNMSIKNGLLSNDDMRAILKKRDMVGEDGRKKLQSLRFKLEAQKILLSKTLKVKANQERIKNIIHEIESEIRHLEYKELSKLSMTADARAEESKLLYLCWASCFNFDLDKLYWDTYQDFLKESDISFRQNIFVEFITFYRGIPTECIRFIARSNLWRIRYVTSLKVSESLFGIPTSKYTTDMLNLAYWSHYYQNIYEMMPDDQPAQDVIEDDVALDAYMEDYYREKKRDTYARKNRNKLGTHKLSAFDKEEVIVTRSNELYEDIEFNTPKEAQSIKDRTEIRKKTRISKKGRVGTAPDRSPTK